MKKDMVTGLVLSRRFRRYNRFSRLKTIINKRKVFSYYVKLLLVADRLEQHFLFSTVHTINFTSTVYGHSKISIQYFCLLLFPLSATGQEWNKQDSLRLQQMLESGQEIKINRKFIEKVEQNMYSRKPFVDFDPTLPTLKSSMIFRNLPFALIRHS